MWILIFLRAKFLFGGPAITHRCSVGEMCGFSTHLCIRFRVAISQVFPNAEIIPSTFDNFTQHLDQGKDKLPIITAEAGDVSNYSISLNLIKTTSSLTHYSFRRGYMVSRVTHKKFLE